MRGVPMPESGRSITRRAFTTAGVGAVAALGASPLAAFQAATMGKPVGADVEAANVKVVNVFCAAFAKKDIDTIAGSLADDCTYRLLQNRPAVVGKAAVVETIKGF